MTSTHLAICIRKFLVHFEPKVRINVVGRAKPLQKWLKIGQLMAIFSHKWLMLWPKNHIFINISWHGSCGPLLSSFEVLEVPKTDKSSIVWRHHSKTPVPLVCTGGHSTTWNFHEKFTTWCSNEKGGGSKAFWTILKKTALFLRDGFPYLGIFA